MAKKISLKEQGDQALLSLLTKIQQKMIYDRSFDELVIDESEDNLIATKILHAKYNFLYRQVRLRRPKS